MAINFLHIRSDAWQVVAALKKVLDASVALFDADRKRWHQSPFEKELPAAYRLGDANRESPWTKRPICRIDARVNDRWTLYVFRRRSMHPNAQALVTWAAEKLAGLLPRMQAADDPVVRPAHGGGTPGAAELGIPVAWAKRKGN